MKTLFELETLSHRMEFSSKEEAKRELIRRLMKNGATGEQAKYIVEQTISNARREGIREAVRKTSTILTSTGLKGMGSFLHLFTKYLLVERKALPPGPGIIEGSIRYLQECQVAKSIYTTQNDNRIEALLVNLKEQGVRAKDVEQVYTQAVRKENGVERVYKWISGRQPNSRITKGRGLDTPEIKDILRAIVRVVRLQKAIRTERVAIAARRQQEISDELLSRKVYAEYAFWNRKKKARQEVIDLLVVEGIPEDKAADLVKQAERTAKGQGPRRAALKLITGAAVLGISLGIVNIIPLMIALAGDAGEKARQKGKDKKSGIVEGRLRVIDDDSPGRGLAKRYSKVVLPVSHFVSDGMVREILKEQGVSSRSERNKIIKISTKIAVMRESPAYGVQAFMRMTPKGTLKMSRAHVLKDYYQERIDRLEKPKEKFSGVVEEEKKKKKGISAISKEGVYTQVAKVA